MVQNLWRGLVTSLDADEGSPKSKYWMLASMLSLVLYKVEVQHTTSPELHIGSLPLNHQEIPRLSCVYLKFICWSPDPQDLKMWWYLEKRPVERWLNYNKVFSHPAYSFPGVHTPPFLYLFDGCVQASINAVPGVVCEQVGKGFLCAKKQTKPSLGAVGLKRD